MDKPIRWFQTALWLATFLFITSCQDLGLDVTEGGPGVIVPGKSVDGIGLGDSKEKVEAILGSPTITGDAYGIYRGWRLYGYQEGTQPRLDFGFIDNGNGYGPLDWISVGVAYRGKTKEGIGIGSTLSKVHLAFGVPDTTLFWPEQHTIADYYCMNQKKFEVHYTDSLVSACSMGYFVPMPENPLDPCK